METSNQPKGRADRVDVAEMTLEDIQTARAFRHGDRLMVVIGDEVYALPKGVATELAWDICSHLDAMSH